MAFPAGWSYYKAHTVTGSTAGSLSDYAVPIVVNSGSGSDSGNEVYLGGNAANWPYDVRFTDASGTEIDFWREPDWTASAATFWVEIPSVPASPSTVDIRVYYGNASGTDASDGAATFPVYVGGDKATFDWTVAAGEWGNGRFFDIAKDTTNSPYLNVNGYVACQVKDGSTWYSFFRDGLDEISYISSADGKTSWSSATKVITKSDLNTPWFGTDADGMFGPQVWKEGSTWYMVFMANETGTGTGYFETGYATASSITGPWTVSSDSPIIASASEHRESTGIIKDGSTYYFYVNDIGSAAARHVDLYTGTSLSGLSLATAGIFEQGRHTTQPFKYDGEFYIIVGHYTEDPSARSHFELWKKTGTQNPAITAGNRELVGILLGAEGDSLWDDDDVDGPWLPTDSIDKDVSNNPVGASTIRLYYGATSAATGSQRKLGFTEDFSLSDLVGGGTVNPAKSYILATHPSAAHTLIRSTASAPADVEIRGAVQFAANQHNGRDCLGVRATTATAWYGACLLNGSSDELELVEYTGSFSVLTQNTSVTWAGNGTEYPAWCRAHGTSITCFANDGTDRNLGPQTDGTNTGSQPIVLRHWGGAGDSFFRYIRAREYEDPEPTSTSWGSETENPDAGGGGYSGLTLMGVG